MTINEIKINPEGLSTLATSLNRELDNVENRLSGFVEESSSKFIESLIENENCIDAYIQENIINEGRYLVKLIENIKTVFLEADNQLSREMEK